MAQTWQQLNGVIPSSSRGVPSSSRGVPGAYGVRNMPTVRSLSRAPSRLSHHQVACDLPPFLARLNRVATIVPLPIFFAVGALLGVLFALLVVTSARKSAHRPSTDVTISYVQQGPVTSSPTL